MVLEQQLRLEDLQAAILSLPASEKPSETTLI